MIETPMLGNILGQVKSLEGVLKHLGGHEHAALAACGELLRSCSGRIIVTGMGASFFAAIPAVQALETSGRRVHFVESAELLHFGDGSWRKEDVAILISRSGGSIETLQLGKKLKKAGVRSIAVTNVLGSQLAKEADLTLFIGSDTDELIAVQTYTGTLLALLLLAEQARLSRSKGVAAECIATLPSLQKHIDLSLEESEEWQEFFLGDGPLYLLGRGGALASVYEGALLFSETAKMATVAMSSGQFRHGPVEVVTPRFRVVVIGTPQRTSDLDWELATNLCSMNAEVRWLGPQLAEHQNDVLQLLPWADNVPSALMPLFDIVPLQVAAYRTALWLGIRPGDFRYASEITGQESGFPLFESKV